MNLFYDGAGSSAVELSGVNMALADIFASGTALFSGNDVITGGFGSQALYGYGGNDFLNGFSNGPVHDTLYGGEGNDTFNLTLMGDTTEYDAVIFGGSGRDTIDINWGEPWQFSRHSGRQPSGHAAHQCGSPALFRRGFCEWQRGLSQGHRFGHTWARLSGLAGAGRD